jgi:uncharacterized protein (TIGR02001 family)
MNPALTALATALAVAAPALAETRSPVAILSTQDDGAAGLVITGGVTLEFTNGEYGHGTGPSLSTEAYVEAGINGFHAGIYGLMTDERTDNEVDLYLGYRRDLASGLSWDIGYTRYAYPRDGGDCCGEVTLGLDKSFGDNLSLGIDLAYDPVARIGNAYVDGEYSLNDTWTLSATFGVYQIEDAPNEREWDFGASYALNDEVALDLRWYDSTAYDGYAALAISFDTTLLGN